jgi:hypothetical protein
MWSGIFKQAASGYACSNQFWWMLRRFQTGLYLQNMLCHVHPEGQPSVAPEGGSHLSATIRQKLQGSVKQKEE